MSHSKVIRWLFGVGMVAAVAAALVTQGLVGGASTRNLHPANSPIVDVSPGEKIDRTVKLEMRKFDGDDRIPIAGPDGATYFASKAAFERMMRAQFAKQFGSTFDPADQLVAVVNASGDHVGYFAQGAGYIPREVVESPNFSLCEIQGAASSHFELQADGTKVEIQDRC